MDIAYVPVITGSNMRLEGPMSELRIDVIPVADRAERPIGYGIIGTSCCHCAVYQTLSPRRQKAQPSGNLQEKLPCNSEPNECASLGVAHTAVAANLHEF